MVLFPQSGDVTADATEDIRTPVGAKGARDFLLQFGHANVPFCEIVVKGNGKIGEKAQVRIFVSDEAVKQVARIGLGNPASLPLSAWGMWMLLMSRCDDAVKEALDTQLYLLWECGESLCTSSFDHTPGDAQQTTELPRPELLWLLLMQGNQLAQQVCIAKSMLGVFARPLEKVH